ncbi:unnamed protein product [Taenia asiatica]|uniref:Glypican n=1 Tax=Taenia asiatica TaxID=60517 RepID=A0A158R849_TAEAS|nr:unnamed protein product [Taenia asiatica]
MLILTLHSSDFFRSDLTEARNRLHEAFSGIYGYNYKVNHAFFFQFFNDLEAYMAGRRGDLAQLVTSFFNQLRTSIVVLMEKAEVATGSTVTSDSQRINCLSEALGKQNAFDLTDVHLREQFLQVYPPARMLVNSLAAGSKLLRTIVEDVSKRPECIVAFSRFRYCGTYCGAREGKQAEICSVACDNFIKACFADASSGSSKSLPHVWSKLITAITVTTKRLERTQNFASVNKDLHIFLSEAITYVHQKYATVKPSLIQECKYSTSGGSGGSASPHSASGWPYGYRVRRSSNSSSDSTELLRTKRQSSYPGAAWQPQPLAWGSPPGSLSNPQQPAASQSHASYQSYFPPNRQGGVGSGGSSSQHFANAPEKLSKWAAQLKLYYSGVQDLFSRTPSSVCAGTTQQNSACWNPPPVPLTGQTKRFTTAVTDLNSVAERLDFNSQNNGDPEALELGARMLAKAKMRNTSAPHHGTPSLLQPLNSANPIYGQPQMLPHDPWRTGAVNTFASAQPIQPPPPSSSDGGNQYSPGASYQIQSPGAPFPSPMGMNAPESGYDPAGGVQGPPPPRQPAYPPQPERPPQPDFSSPHAPLPAPGGAAQSQHSLPSNQPWSGSADTEASGLGGNGEGGSWNQGEPWQQPMPPPPNPWEPQRPPPLSPQSQPQPPRTPDGMENNYHWPPNYYPDQQGSGDGVLPNPEAYPQPPPPVGIIPTTTTTTTTSPPPPPPETMTSTTMSSTTTTTTPIPVPPTLLPTLPPIPSVSESTVRPMKVENANASLPPPPPASIGGLDDEDFGQPTAPPQPLPTSTQQPWGPHQPVPPFELEASGYYPEAGGVGGEEGGVPQPPPPPPPPPAPPDCSPEAIASAGSGADPRCLAGGEPDQSVAYPSPRAPPSHWQPPEHPNLGEGGAGSGFPPDGLEPPPPPPHPYPSYVETSPGERPEYGGLPNFEGLAPLAGTPLPPADLNRPYLPPPATQKQLPPSSTAVPPRELPPDVWLPVPELQPGDPKLPDSKLFLPDFPPHRGRPMLSTGEGNTAMTTFNHLVVIAPLLITANLLV